MENDFKKSLKFDIPTKFPYDTGFDITEKEQADLIMNTVYREFAKYNDKFSSEEVQNYFHNLVVTVLLEYSKHFPDYSIESNYRFKAPKSLADKIIDYISRADRSQLVPKQEEGKYECIMDEIKDMFAMKLVLVGRPSTFHSKDKKINELVEEKIENQEFMAQMQEFQSKLIEDEFCVNPVYKYDVTKKEYYSKCIQIIDKIISVLPPEAKDRIAEYQKMKDSIAESLDIVDTMPEGTLIDENDYPSESIDFSKLLNDFSSKIYDKLDLEILSRQATSIFSESEQIKKLGIKMVGFKEKRTSRGYMSNFVYLDTPLGTVECQLQPENAYKDGNYGFSSHGEMQGKKIKGFKIPNPNDPNDVKRFKHSVAYVSPKYYVARIDDVEEGKVIVQGYTDYKNYRNVIGQVRKGSIQEAALSSYFEKLYSLRDRIFDSNGNGPTMEFIESDITKYSNSDNLKELINKNTERETH